MYLAKVWCQKYKHKCKFSHFFDIRADSSNIPYPSQVEVRQRRSCFSCNRGHLGQGGRRSLQLSQATPDPNIRRHTAGNRVNP